MYDENDPVGQAVKMGAKLFAIVADEVTKAYGADGEVIIRKAVNRYGTMRAEGIRKMILADGKEVTFETTEHYSDYPENNAWDSDGQIKGNTFREVTRKCPFSEGFREVGLENAGSLYCKEIDLALNKYFFGDIDFQRPKLFTDGPDAPCEMVVTKKTILKMTSKKG